MSGSPGPVADSVYGGQVEMDQCQLSLAAVFVAIPVLYTIAGSLLESLLESKLESLFECLLGSLLERASHWEE